MEPRYPSGILCSSWVVPSQMPQKYHVHFSFYGFIPSLSMRCFSLSPVPPNLILLIQVLHRSSHLQLILQWSPTPEFLQYLLSDSHNSSLIMFAHFILVPWTYKGQGENHGWHFRIHTHIQKKNPHRACTTWHRVRRAQDFLLLSDK